MFRKRLVVLLFIAGILCGCRASPPAQHAAALQSILSWVAASRMAGEAWVRHQAPTPYTRSTLLSAARELRDQRQDFQQIPDSALPVDSSRQQLQELPDLIERLMNAVKAGDRPAAQLLVGKLAVEERLLRRLNEEVKQESDQSSGG